MKKCVCVEENRGKGEIKKTKGEENVAEKKMVLCWFFFFFFFEKGCCVGYTCSVGQGHEPIFF